jgi:hypothetical protein
MTDFTTLIDIEPNLHFTNFTNNYTMEDKKGGFNPKSRLSSIDKSGNGFKSLTKSDEKQVKGGVRTVEGEKWNTPCGTGTATPN